MSTAPAPAPATAVELDDIQGLVRFGYKYHTQSCFLLLRVKDSGAARAWLASAPVSSAATTASPPPTVLQLALSSEGLRALGVAGDIVEAFSADFVSGMGSEPSRSRRLGDMGANAPGQWQWGTGARLPHVLLLLYALPGRLDEWQRQIEAQCAAGFDTLARLTCGDRLGFEPFGFVDGLSQPQPDWGRERPALDAERPDYGNLTCLGEFLLGYPNEYGGYTDRPLLAPERDAGSLLPRAEDAPELADLGRNGSYLVLRQLQQDVRGFWQYLDRQAGGDPALREKLAAALVGRTLQGVPLEPLDQAAPPAADAAPDLNAFDYQADPRGTRCPLGAHVRRANPRSADLPPGEAGLLSWLKRTLGFDAQARGLDLVASTRFHRLLRRGRAYGDAVPPAQALAAASTGADTGLHFICLGASIARQFEFVQAAWLNSTHFNGLQNESDPLLGTRLPTPDGQATDGFSMPQAQGADQKLAGLPQFVTVRGGAYFFLPGIRALRYLAGAAQGGSP
ncbi:MAG: peroxidase [Proteobacteria bacterium]|nr:peroxidase [Pseudomonadota bacterium]MBS0493694.1 peroxidase [Pseudomonadota bacterium]